MSTYIGLFILLYWLAVALIGIAIVCEDVLAAWERRTWQRIKDAAAAVRLFVQHECQVLHKGRVRRSASIGRAETRPARYNAGENIHKPNGGQTHESI